MIKTKQGRTVKKKRYETMKEPMVVYDKLNPKHFAVVSEIHHTDKQIANAKDNHVKKHLSNNDLPKPVLSLANSIKKRLEELEKLYSEPKTYRCFNCNHKGNCNKCKGTTDPTVKPSEWRE